MNIRSNNRKATAPRLYGDNAETFHIIGNGNIGHDKNIREVVENIADFIRYLTQKEHALLKLMIQYDLLNTRFFGTVPCDQVNIFFR